MKRFFKTIVIAIHIGFSVNAQQIDHVISVYKDLDSAVINYKQLGFEIKPGVLHKNGLINAHIKFKNGTAFELMSVGEIAIGSMAKNYEKLIEEGDGGVYLALAGFSIDQLKEMLKGTGIKYSVSRNQSWDYLTFKDSDLEHIFFINYHIKVNQSYFELHHKNKTNGIGEVWIEGNQNLKELLIAIGIDSKGTFEDSQFGTVEKFSAKNADIVVILCENITDRYRIQRIVLKDFENKETLLMDLH